MFFQRWIGFAGLCLAMPGYAGHEDQSRRSGFIESAPAEQLVSQALQNSPALLADQAQLEATRLTIGPASALRDPQFDVLLAPNTLDGFTAPGGRQRQLSGNVRISQALPWPGTRRLRGDLAHGQWLSQQAALADLRLQIAAQVRIGYARWVLVHQALALNAQYQALVDEWRQVAQTRYANGLASQQDVLTAEVQLALQRHHALQWQRQARAAQAQLNALLDQPPDKPLPEPVPLPAPQGLPPQSQLQDLALSQHPELREIEAQRAVAQSQIELARKDFYPQLQVSVGHEGLRPATDTRWVVGASLNLPFGQDKRRAALAGAQAQQQATQAQLAQRRADLLSELAQARAAVDEAGHAIALYQAELLPRSRESVGAAQAQYGAGGGDFAGLIEAQERQLQVELDFVRAQADYFIAIAQLRRWLGAPDQANPAPLTGVSQ